jgi:cyclohexa-1,5-dienecarbonyl-CoA hydratase
MESPVRRSDQHEGQLVRLLLDRPRGNILDLEMVSAIRRELSHIGTEAKLLVFEGAGETFSFGASVPEHFPNMIGTMLPNFHQLFWDLEALAVPTAAVVRGHCLGGGFELAIWCGMVFCSPTARFGAPETKLGVFPPIAAIGLPWRVRGARSTQLILSGELVNAEAAVEEGIADRCDDDPEAAMREWFSTAIAPKSTIALRTAWRASRRLLADSLKNDLPALETLYLNELMAHRDPLEGLTAFVERREPVWRNQ